MCLIPTTNVPTHIGERVVWKILQRRPRTVWVKAKLSSVFQPHEWGPGVNRSSRESPSISWKEFSDEYIESGFHVYTDKDEAEKFVITSIEVLVEVTVNSYDFVAENTELKEAVYTKVTLSDSEYTKAMRIK